MTLALIKGWRRSICTVTILAVAAFSSFNSHSVSEQPDLTENSSPANFIFMIDVSGSMVDRDNDVLSGNGARITLFEALRSALQAIIADERLVARNSRLAVITFGTEVREKSGWPAVIGSTEERASLIDKISSAEELRADPRGDTYMARALRLAFDRASQFESSTALCTPTFIIMLTDGCDDPPRSASRTGRIEDIARRFKDKQQSVRERTGYNNFIVRVIGLQSTPAKQDCRTSAPTVAEMMGGQFLNIREQDGESVQDKIAATLKSVFSGKHGRIRIAEPYLDFGLPAANGESTASLTLSSRSCKDESITGIESRPAGNILSQLAELPHKQTSLIPLTTGWENQISIKLNDSPVAVPSSLKSRLEVRVTLTLNNQSSLDPGNYAGLLGFNSSAQTGDIPFLFTVPSRIEISPTPISGKTRKTSFSSSDGQRASLRFKIIPKLLSGETDNSINLSLSTLTKGNGSHELAIPKEMILLKTDRLTGNPISIDLSGNRTREVQLEIQLGQSIPPGRYTGNLQIEGANGSTRKPETVPVSFTLQNSLCQEFCGTILFLLILFGLVSIYIILIHRSKQRSLE